MFLINFVFLVSSSRDILKSDLYRNEPMATNPSESKLCLVGMNYSISFSMLFEAPKNKLTSLIKDQNCDDALSVLGFHIPCPQNITHMEKLWGN